jgi:hypothetical protein
MQYAEALPGLIRDNIGNAPLTVRVLFYAQSRMQKQPFVGVDIHFTKDDPNGPVPPIHQADLEVPG